MEEVLAGGMFDGRKVGQLHSCVLASRDPPRLVSLYFIVREKTGSETLETL